MPISVTGRREEVESEGQVLQFGLNHGGEGSTGAESLGDLDGAIERERFVATWPKRECNNHRVNWLSASSSHVLHGCPPL